MRSSSTNWKLAQYHLKESVTFFDRAVAYGSATMTEDWKKSLKVVDTLIILQKSGLNQN